MPTTHRDGHRDEIGSETRSRSGRTVPANLSSGQRSDHALSSSSSSVSETAPREPLSTWNGKSEQEEEKEMKKDHGSASKERVEETEAATGGQVKPCDTTKLARQQKTNEIVLVTPDGAIGEVGTLACAPIRASRHCMLTPSHRRPSGRESVYHGGAFGIPGP